MNPPLCICNGLIRSGSTWSFNVCRELMQRLGIHLKRPSASVYLHAPHLDGFIQQQWQRAPGPTVIKAHELGPVAVSVLKDGKVRGVCTFRDPRDSVASDMVFMGRGMDHSIARVNMSLECLRACESAGGMLFVRYEQMMSDRLNEIRRIARHLGIHVDTSVVQAVDSKTNLQTSKTVCDDIRRGAIREVFAIDSHRVDPKTHLHENHIGNARVGRWRDELSLDQARYVTDLFSPWLLKWGYETQESLNRQLAQTAAMETVAETLEAGVPLEAGSIQSMLMDRQLAGVTQRQSHSV